ncbi:MAG: leucine-rich repeat domain-containing protein [Phycisphaerae bacterium]|nr:leucine-rich repeat domain-containing protein [Phycisphaerae bacterium]
MKTQRIAIVLLATILAAAATTRAEDPVHFADAALKTVVEEQLGIANPTPKAMLGLITLNAPNRKIASLVGLEYAKNLSDLVLEGNQISDVSPLAGLIGLRRLELNSNQVKDITPLSSLIGLTRLGLYENRVDSLKRLFALVLLESLELRHNKLTNLDGLSGLVSLKVAELGANEIIDISALAGLTNLDRLNLAQNKINDIKPLAGLTGLIYLDLSENDLTDIRPLAGLTKLTELYLQNPVYETGPNQIRDIGPLAKLVKLTALNLEGNHVADTSALSGMAKLTSLNLRHNEISDISGLAGLRSLTYLYLGDDELGRDNEINDITPLKDMATLDCLNLTGNPITDLTPLAGLTALRELGIGKTQVTDIRALASLKSLQSFDAAFTPVADLGPLSKLTNLTTLGFYGSRSIYDVSPLAGLTKLDTLNLTSNYVSNISALAGLTNVQSLSLGDNRISDISPLTGLTNLRELHLDYNPLDAKACAIYIPVIKLNNPGIKIYYDACLGRVYTLTVSTTPGGSVTNPGEGAFICNDGESVPIEAVAKAGYRFTNWSGTAVSAGKVAKPNSASTTVVVSADYTLVANFKKKPTLTISSTPGGSVSKPGIGTFVCAEGASVAIEAVAQSGYYFVNWSGTAVTAGKVAKPNLASTTVIVSADYTLVANFKKNRTLTVSSTLGGSVTKPGEGAFVYGEGVSVPIEAVAKVGYRFANWSGTAVTAGKVAMPNSASTTVIVSADYTLVANFKKSNCTLTISSTLGGSVTKPGEGAFVYGEGESVPIEAVAKAGYRFTSWSGTAVAAGKVAKPDAAKTSVVLSADYTLIANFALAAILEDFEMGKLNTGWSSPGYPWWYVTSEDAHAGKYSARAGAIDDNESTSLTLRANVTEGQISFWRKVSSEEGYDVYRFSIDGKLQETLSGEQGWKEVSFPVSAGSHTFVWEYAKDSGSFRGADTVYIDDVSIPAAP